MRSYGLSAAVALSAASLVTAQTFTKCNPLLKSCPADPAFGKEQVDCDFSKGSCSSFTSAINTDVKYNEKGAQFQIDSETNAPTISTGQYIFFGRVEVVVQAAPGRGIVTSAVLLSDDLDEIDWEWLGGDNTQVQSNYFSKGDTSSYDRVAFHPVPNPTGQFNTYTIDWTPEAVTWSINGQSVRTLTYAAAKGGSSFPQTPMQVRLGTWVAGRQGASEGTVQWGGGYADFSQAPFNGYYKSIKIVDYAGKSQPAAEDVKEYVYGDKTGSYQSIKVVPGKASQGDINPASSSSPVSSSPASSSQVSSGPASSSQVSSSPSGGSPAPTTTPILSGQPSTMTTMVSSGSGSSKSDHVSKSVESVSGTVVSTSTVESTSTSSHLNATSGEAPATGNTTPSALPRSTSASGAPAKLADASLASASAFPTASPVASAASTDTFVPMSAAAAITFAKPVVTLAGLAILAHMLL